MQFEKKRYVPDRLERSVEHLQKSVTVSVNVTVQGTAVGTSGEAVARTGVGVDDAEGAQPEKITHNIATMRSKCFERILY